MEWAEQEKGWVVYRCVFGYNEHIVVKSVVFKKRHFAREKVIRIKAKWQIMNEGAALSGRCTRGSGPAATVGTPSMSFRLSQTRHA